MTKNTSYHYSIIIPHKNTPVFWNAVCAQFPLGMKFKSLSLMTTATPNLSIFSFSGKRQKNTEILFTKEGKGAGYARNIGLSTPVANGLSLQMQTISLQPIVLLS